MSLKPIYSRTFDGTTWQIPTGRPTIREMRAALRELDEELAKWEAYSTAGADAPIEILDVTRNGEVVILVNEPWRMDS